MTAAQQLVERLVLAFEPVDFPNASRDIAIAQAGHESGWGISRASRAHNFWNLTRIPSDHRPVIEGPDMEPDGHGGMRPIVQRFRAYQSDHEACLDFLAFIGPDTRYAKAWAALLAENPAEYARELRAAGFFTAPLAGYQTSLAGCLALVRRILHPPEVA